MAQPAPYDRAFNFSNFQATEPTDPLPATSVDEEYNRIKAVFDNILENLALIQRDDTALANNSVGFDQLRAEVSVGINPPTVWVTATNYVSRDTVFVDTSFYFCEESHISDVFSTDLAAGKWTLIADFGVITGASGVGYNNATSGLAAVNVQTAIDELVVDIGAVDTDLAVVEAKIPTFATHGSKLVKVNAGATAFEYLTDDTLRYSAQTLTAAVQAQVRANVSAALKGRLYGLTTSNNGSDATNDIDIAAGEAASTETNPVLMVLASALTKRLDAAWAVGTGNGGLDTGSIANTSYHVWLIQRSDTGVVDVLFSASATSPTMPANYDRKRRISSFIRVSASIKPFVQVGDRFLYTNGGVQDRSSTGATATTLLTVSVPVGINVRAIIGQLQSCSTLGSQQTSLADGNTGGGAGVDTPVAFTVLAGEVCIWAGTFLTNTSAQIYIRVVVTSGTLASNVTTTYGYEDRRGQDG